MDPVVYSEIRKIDSRPVATPAVPGSLADILTRAGELPMANFVYHETTSQTLVTALDISGTGAVKVFSYIAGTATGTIKITVDGVVIFPITTEDLLHQYFISFSMPVTFNTSLKVEILASNSAGLGDCVVVYNLTA